MSILDSLFSGAVSSTKTSLLSSLEDAQRKLEAQVGRFLTTGQIIADMRTRAEQYRNSPKPEVKNRAAALVSRSNGLLTQYGSLKDQASSLITKLLTLKNNLSSDPAFNVDPKLAGTSVAARVASQSSAILSASGESLTLLSRLQSHIKDTNALVSEVSALDQYSEGKGVDAKLDGATSFIQGTTKMTVGIIAVGVLAYFMVPSMLVRTVRRAAR